MPSNCTLEDLLHLALKTPEIGAVNFNYLYQVIHEILGHLEILKLPATVSHESDGGMQLLSEGYVPLAITQGGYEVERAVNGVISRRSSHKERSNIERKDDRRDYCASVLENTAGNNGKESGMIGARSDAKVRKSREENVIERKANSGRSKTRGENNEGKSNTEILKKSTQKSVAKIGGSRTKDDIKIEKVPSKKTSIEISDEREQDRDKVDSERKESEAKIDGVREQCDDEIDGEREQDEYEVDDEREKNGSMIDIGEKQDRDEMDMTDAQGRNDSAPIKDKNKIKKVMLRNGSQPPKKDNNKKQFVSEAIQRAPVPLNILRLSMSETSPAPSRRPMKITKTTSERGLQAKLNVLERPQIDWENVVSAVKNSQSPVSDLWQILNTSRRLEAAEDTINGMSNFIDSISSDLSEVRDVVDKKLTDGSNAVNEDGDAISKEARNKTNDQNSRTAADSEGAIVSRCVNELSKTLTSSLKQLEDRINVCATKKDLEDYCSSSTVASIVEDRMKSAPLQKGDERDEGSDEDTFVEEKPIAKRESRTKLLHMAMSRIGKVEELISMLTDELQKVESLLDSKADKIDEGIFAKLNQKITEMNDKMVQQQSSSQDYSSLQNQVENLKNESKALKFKTDKTSKEQIEIYKKIQKLETELGHLTEAVYKRFGSVKDSSMSRSEEDGLQKIKKILSSLQDAHKRLETQVLGMNRTVQEATKKLSTIDTALEDVQEKKVDKDALNKLLELKADKIVVNQKVSQANFDSVMVNIERNLQNIIQKADEQETKVEQFFAKIEVRFERKMNREEFEKWRRNLEIQLKRIQDNIQNPNISEDGAAGFRKPLLRDFHCISCDKPVEILQQEAIPSLSLPQSLPGNRSIRPYTTFELDDIRKSIRGASNKERFEVAHEREEIQRHFLRLCGTQDIDALALQTSRACGGSHTMLDVQKRSLIKAAMLYREEIFPIMFPPSVPIESEVIGRDGRIYRARQEHLPPLNQPQQTNLQPNSDAPKVTMPSIHQGKPDDKPSSR